MIKSEAVTVLTPLYILKSWHIYIFPLGRVLISHPHVYISVGIVCDP